jgi:hypothetical protein
MVPGTGTLMPIIGTALGLLLLGIVVISVIFRGHKSAASASTSWSAFCNGEPTGDSISIDTESTVDLTVAVSDWESASQFDDGLISVSGISDAQESDAGSFGNELSDASNLDCAGSDSGSLGDAVVCGPRL